VLLNLTNDAWFGPTPTPVQHLALATFRAVEHRVWLVRAANSGISAIVAPDGRIVRSSATFTRGVLSGTFAPRTTTTFYTRFGDLFAWSALGVTVAAVVPTSLRRRRPAVVASDATSCRVKQVAAAFGADVFEVETGEINVVTKMQDLERQGLCAVIGVEGPNGGTIFAGTTCRDGTLVGAGALLAAADEELARARADLDAERQRRAEDAEQQQRWG